MIETEEKVIRELSKKGVVVVDKIVFVPNDHGCGNRSFGRIDNLKSHKYTVIFLKLLSEQKLKSAVKKLQAEKANSVDIANMVKAMKR